MRTGDASPSRGLNQGYTQAEVARFLGVNVRSVQTWVAAYREKGEAGLAGTTAPG